MRPHKKVNRGWARAYGPISAEGGHKAHLSALAYLSDRLFLATAWDVHQSKASLLDSYQQPKHQNPPGVDQERKNLSSVPDGSATKPELGMLVSLDHSIYFHDAKGFRADEWMLTEKESPWAGDGRGMVIQRIYTQHGKLIASCFQEVGSRDQG